MGELPETAVALHRIPAARRRQIYRQLLKMEAVLKSHGVADAFSKEGSEGISEAHEFCRDLFSAVTNSGALLRAPPPHKEADGK